MTEIHLDSAISVYVLIPILFVVIFTNVIRTNITKISGKPQPPKSELNEICLNNFLNFNKIKNLNSNKKFQKIEKIKKLKIPSNSNPMEKLMKQNSDPSAAMNMLKSQFAFIGIQGTLAYWVSHLFSGFLVAKTPFPLTFKIKGMLQRGVDVAALDTSYVSSLSWYFFVMISSSNLVSLFHYLTSDELPEGLSSSVSSEEMMMMATGGMVPPMGPSGLDYKKEVESLIENLKVKENEKFDENLEISLIDKLRGN
jgi:hypothetical protein